MDNPVPDPGPSPERFRLMAETGPAVTWTADADGHVTWISRRWYEYTGLNREDDPRGWTRNGVLHPDDVPAMLAAWRRSISEGVEHEVEARHRRHDGTYRWFITRAVPCRDDDGHVVQWFGSTVDVDEHRQSSEAMSFLARASAALADTNDEEAALTSIADLAVPAFCDWFGVHLREPGGEIRRLAVRHLDPARIAFVDALYSEYPPGEGEPYGAQAVILAGQPIWAPRYREMVPAMARDARHRDLLLGVGTRSFACVPMRLRGIVIGALTFATAESQRDFSEIHFRAMEDLASRAAVAIENVRLVRALREGDRRKDEFLAVLAHELRNPLAPVRNAVQILRDKSAAPPQMQWASDVIDRQVRQMSRLVDDLLDVSRITRGRIELRREHMTLASVVASAVEASRPSIERGRQELTIALPAEPLHLDADFARLSQVISNLLNNAAKYTPAGGRIRLSVERIGAQAVVRISDNGIGIPHDQLERVFDMFAQLTRSGTQDQSGLGIGLTLVKQLVELHGGFVEARSDGENRGSEFIVRLPMGPEPLPVAPEAPGASGQPVAVMGLKILVVDDNRDAADSLSWLLRSTGHEVAVAYDGEESLEAAARVVPEVVLLDIGLPKVHGYDVARRLRKAYGPAMVLVAITGWGQEEDRRRSREAGFDYHFTKPVDMRSILDLLATVQTPIEA